MAAKPNTDADEVFEFLDSLPEAKKNDQNDQSKDNGKKDEDILDFLDELEKSNLELNKNKTNSGDSANNNKNKKKASNNTKQESKPQSVGKEETKKAPIKNNEQKPVKEEIKEVPLDEVTNKEESINENQEQDSVPKEGTPLNDPITSFSNWWSSSGSAAVTNIWNKTQKQASELQKKIVDEQSQIPIKELTSLTSKLKTSTITDLANRLQEIVVGETEEVLRIHLVHDLVNYPLLQYHVEQKFHDVLSSQVQGGIRIFVDEWTNPNERELYEKEVEPTSKESKKRQLNMFNGKVVEGEKLAFANLDNAIKLFHKSRENIIKQQKEAKLAETDQDQESKQSDTEAGDEEDNISDIFISILPVSVPGTNKDDPIKTTDGNAPGNFSFIIVLKDITNDITSITRSQGYPSKWAGWLEGSYELTSKDDAISQAKEKDEKKKQSSSNEEDEEDEEDESNNIDPSEWVKEWIEDGLSLTFGIAAQNYVIERMGF
ncbi:hypothetical protein Kpol_1031p29 [Vanderwaltozyma polyspora DSM 70294]|uniref:Maintenance of telomere capping protein 1 n=1 Tax=Vanderwaltozyma polyspora (strain ATCC 22028 / DSM 70294 / BCRC 21397 / CBS 2163 / NBRC 10782 / NRRL Y-8283 / UCD 57-17) TaxID=436907 RepID=A7THW3_VANPO|nr:uncharacterized protein Kpol_1031p29 [Vanderwaltozyma polyspora DSM 70294]EDO18125.1 hypothetical protein Kpol_1031p29 [Vanderwaltozyma polyspora DSM 70294]